MQYMTMGQRHNITNKELFDMGVKCVKAAKEKKIAPIEVYLWEYQNRVFLIGLGDHILIDGEPAHTVWELKTEEIK